jgi:hypothetical protein
VFVAIGKENAEFSGFLNFIRKAATTIDAAITFPCLIEYDGGGVALRTLG